MSCVMAENALFYIILMLATNINYAFSSPQQSETSVEFIPQRIEIQTPRQFQPSRKTTNNKQITSVAEITQNTNTFDFIPQLLQLTELYPSKRQPRLMVPTGKMPVTQSTATPVIVRNTQVIGPSRRFVSTLQSAVAQSTVVPAVVQSPQGVESADNPLFAAALDYKLPQQNLAYPTYSPQPDLQTLTSAVRSNPVLTALLLSTLLGHRHHVGYNSQHPTPDPFVSLLLSHYGRYIPRPGRYNGLYGYNAANNIHNTKPFGAYKIYDDSN